MLSSRFYETETKTTKSEDTAYFNSEETKSKNFRTSLNVRILQHWNECDKFQKKIA